MKGHFLRSKNSPIFQNDKKKEKVAAKIINFSFIGHAKPSYSTDRKISGPTRGEMS